LDEIVAERAGVTRSRARSLIIAGRVRVDGSPATKPGASVGTSASVTVERPKPFVSRGGEKLEGALDDFALDVRGARALDVGASTGGFTDCLLARGATHVVALDVGRGQIAHALRGDARVTVIERCNFRLVPDDAYGRDFDVITIDTSFISVVTMLARARTFLATGGAIVALVKPQFEAGRERLGSGGVVRDPEVHRAILHETRAAIVRLGLAPVRIARSHLIGPSGNVEFFALVRESGDAFDDSALEAALVPRASEAVDAVGADVEREEIPS
jgi:23S rRNA (cytidine1920-2'-O)/16S rRNA (cytidine1409-2'-O)-methyltransferase